uniref:Uncharacterized protein n=1 Tax=Anguilla anguilla TaxID=7936 RepID=A0A0E9XYC4_ANGAN
MYKNKCTKCVCEVRVLFFLFFLSRSLFFKEQFSVCSTVPENMPAFLVINSANAGQWFVRGGEKNHTSLASLDIITD